MSSSESDEALTVPAALAAHETNKKKRKTAKGRKLMRWGPDVDQQLLLAIEAVVIEGTVLLDWNSVGEKLFQPVTGEAIKQHLLKLRDARESAQMTTPAKAQGKSAFGSRRGVVRHPPKKADNILNAAEDKEKRIRKPAKAEPVDKGPSDEPLSTNIMHRTLLHEPAIPRQSKSNDSLIVTLTKKRKIDIKEENEGEAKNELAPEKPPKRAKKSTKAPGLVVDDNKPKAVRRGNGKHKPILGSNFDQTVYLEGLKERHLREAREANKDEKPAVIPAIAQAKPATKEIIQPVVVEKKKEKPTPDQTVSVVEEHIFSSRSLRNKTNRPNYRDNQDALSEDQQSESGQVATNGKDDSYDPETFTTNEPQMSVKLANRPKSRDNKGVLFDNQQFQSAKAETSGKAAAFEPEMPKVKKPQSHVVNEQKMFVVQSVEPDEPMFNDNELTFNVNEPTFNVNELKFNANANISTGMYGGHSSFGYVGPPQGYPNYPVNHFEGPLPQLQGHYDMGGGDFLPRGYGAPPQVQDHLDFNLGGPLQYDNGIDQSPRQFSGIRTKDELEEQYKQDFDALINRGSEGYDYELMQ